VSDRLAARRLDFAHNGVRLRAIATRVHHDGRATIRERKRDRTADVAAGAGDDGDFAGKFFGGHAHPSTSCPGSVS